MHTKKNLAPGLLINIHHVFSLIELPCNIVNTEYINSVEPQIYLILFKSFARSFMLMMSTYVFIINLYILTYYYASIAISKFPVIEVPVVFYICITNPTNTGEDAS